MNSARDGNGTPWRIIGPGGGGGQFIPTFSPHDPDTMLVACDMTGAYITKNGGRSWRQFNLRSTVHSFAFDPADPGVMYAGSTGLYRSVDGGGTWHLMFPNPASGVEERMTGDHAEHAFISGDNWPGGIVQCICLDAEHSDRMFIGIRNKQSLFVFASDNGGQQWLPLCAPEGETIHTLFVDPHSPAGNRRLFVFTDRVIESAFVRDRTVVRLALPERAESIVHAAGGLDPANRFPSFYVTVRYEAGHPSPKSEMWKSDNGGESWTELDVRIGGDVPDAGKGGGPQYSLLAVPHSDSRYVYAGVEAYPEYKPQTGAGSVVSYFGIIKSVDGGATWSWALKSDYSAVPANVQPGWAERNYDLPWLWVGPKGVGPIGLSVSPVHPDRCSFTDLASTFITADGGATWRQAYSEDYVDGTVATNGMDVTTCFGVHFDPFDPRHIAVSYTDIGMFHSRNGGETWRHAIRDVPVTWGNTCYWMVFDPEAEGRAWSAWGYAHDLPRPKMFRNGRFFYAQGGVAKSEDGLNTWRKSNDGMPGSSVTTHLVLDPSSPVGSRTLYAAVFDGGVYKSADDGNSWTLCNNGIGGNLNAWRLVLLPDGTLYLLVARGLRAGNVVDGALYKSVDGAAQWVKVPLPAGVNAPNDLIFDPGRPERMYLSCWPVMQEDGSNRFGGLYATEDGGESWNNRFDPAFHVYAAAIHPDNPDTLFLVTFDSSAWRSDDRGATWTRIRGYTFKWGHRPVADPHRPDMMYITTFGSSVWYGPARGDDSAFEDIHPEHVRWLTCDRDRFDSLR